MYLTKTMLAQRSSDPTAYWHSVAYPRALALELPQSPCNDSFLTPLCSNDLRHTIDQELQALRDVFTFFQTRRNALSPICRLPPELLAQIFGSIDDTPRRVRVAPSRGSLPTEAINLGWITVTHVCRHWRTVALEHPRLWSNVSFALGPLWTSEFLARSKATLISLSHLSDPVSIPFDTIPMSISSHVNRVSDIHLRSDAASMRALFKHLSLPAPHLESLQLTVIPTGGFTRSRSAVPVRLPSDLFQNSTPSLRHVSLTRLHVPWADWPFRNLQRLALTLPNSELFPVDESALPTLDQLVDVLSASPDLEALRLSHTLPALPSYVSTLHESYRTVTLPNFKELVLEGRPLECANVLRSMCIPRDARLKIICSSRKEDNTECEMLLSLLRRHLDGNMEVATSGEGMTKTLWITNHASHVAVTTWTQDIHSPHYFSPLTLSSVPSLPSVHPSESSSPLPAPVLDISFSWPAHISRLGPATATPLPSSYAHYPSSTSLSHSPSSSPSSLPHIAHPQPHQSSATTSSDVLLNAICSHLGWTSESGRDVRTVIVSTSLDVSKTRWVEAFEGMQGLRGISASGKAGLGLVEALGSADETRGVFMPNLEWVELYGVDMRSSVLVSEEEEGRFGEPVVEESLDTVLGALRRRQESRFPLRKLKIVGCTVKEEWVEMMKRAMVDAEVEWDGRFGDLEESSESEEDEEVQVWS